VARFSFFIGKGGVGKTTVSSAYALHRAATKPRSRILLLSTDPAHSLADVLQLKLSDRPKRLPSRGQVWARELDAARQIQRFLAAERRDILALLSKGSFLEAEELDPLLDTSLPGMAEVAALLALRDLLDSDYDEIVVDTAPMGHAIRLFQMPAHLARFLEVLEIAASRDATLARHFGGRSRPEPGLERWTRIVGEVQQALSRDGARLTLVTTADPFSLEEAVRSAPAFGAQKIEEIVLNRAVGRPGACVHCRRRAAQTKRSLAFLRKHFPGARLLTGEDPGCPILGIEALRGFAKHVFAGVALPPRAHTKPRKSPPLELHPAEWPALCAPLTLTVGKGGVGKTTVSAALSYHQRRLAEKETVFVCSIDPAPSLDDVFLADIGDEPRPVLRDDKLLAAEFDAVAQFRRWSDDLRARLSHAMSGEQRGLHVDLTLDRRFLLALLEIVPPGVDEIFAIFRIFDLIAERGRVVIDMAPTGHALEVLETPRRLLAWTRLLMKTLAAHRTLHVAQDAAVEVATISQNVRELAAMLRERERSNVVVVTQAEPLPIDETRRLLRSLKKMGAPFGFVIVNRVVMDAGRCARCRLSAEWQSYSLARLSRELRGSELLVAPEMDEAVAGAKQLREFTRRIWKLKRRQE
jgi:arsenite-transporting ATPase